MIHASKRSVNTNVGFQTKLKHSALVRNMAFMNHLESMIESSENNEISLEIFTKDIKIASYPLSLESL